MKLNKSFLYFGVNIELYRKRTMKYVVIFNFHQVTDNFLPAYHNKVTWTNTAFFEKQVLWLKKYFRVISLTDAIEMANNNSIDDKYACITIDDGDRSILNAMEILEKHNVPATFFINSGYLDKKNACWFHIYRYINNNDKYKELIVDDIKKNIVYLRHTKNSEMYNKNSKKIESLFEFIKDDFDMFISLKELCNINTELFHIGLHGYEHQRFSMMSNDWQKENLLKDIDLLSKVAGYKPIFAIPFGRPYDWNNSTIKIALELNLEIVYADGGINTSRDVGYKRIPADGRLLKKLIVL